MRCMELAGLAGVVGAAALVGFGAMAADPFPGADLAAGKEIHSAKRCGSCHAQKSGRDEAHMYLREGRKVNTLFDLRRYVSLCNMELKLDLFPEDERDVGAYVNQQYYKLVK